MNDQQSNPWVEVQRCYGLVSLDEGRALLGARGIPCRVTNESALRMRHNSIFATGGAKLLVRRQELERAQDCLGLARATDEEINYALRVRKSKQLFAMSAGVGGLFGVVIWLRTREFQAAFGVGFIASLVFAVYVGQFFIPKAILRRK